MPVSLQLHACGFRTTIFALWAIIPVAGVCCRGRRPALPHKWLSYEWLQKGGGVKRGPRQQTLHIWGQFCSPLIERGGRDSFLKPSSSSSPEVQRLKPVSEPSLCPLNPPNLLSIFLLHAPLSLPLAAIRAPRGPGRLPALSLTPVFANHFFPCQQVNCFVLPFPAFITLCKLSDMSSTGARRSTHRANAKIMRFGIINEDKLAVAVLLSTRARLHYSLNLPEKMT